jgi:pimeloyl-ACP methyl ester carboxylesterase
MLKSGLIVWLIAGWINHPPTRPHFKPVAPPQPAVAFTVRTDNIPAAQIAGVILPAKGKARGTLFLCHGWGRSKEDLYGWEWIRNQLGWNLVLFDFREHGRSTHSFRLCSLGYHEIWDVKAVVDFGQQQRLAEPYAICGYSLGGSVGLRWAAHDPRIKSVLAVSPYRNGLVAARRFLLTRAHWNAGLFDGRTGFGKMIGRVDLPSDVAKRADLRIWIMVGQHDIFPEADQRAILDASASPAELKRLFVVPGGNHNNLWRWKGDGSVPAHDQIIRDFLSECQRRRGS